MKWQRRDGMEECREARGTRWLADLWQDLRYAVRVLRQKPGFAAVALLTLGLGCGGTTVMFTVINGVLLRPVPYPDPDRLLKLQEKTEYATRFGNLWAFSYPNFVDCRNEVRSADLAAWRYNPATATVKGQAEHVSGREISANLFSVLGVSIARGRAFSAAEDAAGATPVAILSYDFWQRQFGGSDAAVGMPLTIDERTYTIVGVTPATFRLDGDDLDVFTPMGQDRSPAMLNRGRHPGIQTVARLRPGATEAAVQTELEIAGKNLEKRYAATKDRSFVAGPCVPRWAMWARRYGCCWAR